MMTLLTFFDLCYFCGTRCAFVGHSGEQLLIRPCHSCWLSPDLSLYLTVDQARSEFGIEKEELTNVFSRATDPRLQRYLHSRRARVQVPAEACLYREADVAYLALLKWGSYAAVERATSQAQLARTPAPAASAQGDWENSVRGKRKRIIDRLEEGDDFKAPRKNQPVATTSTRPAVRKATVRKAAQGVFYGEKYENVDSLLTDLLNWGRVGRQTKN